MATPHDNHNRGSECSREVSGSGIVTQHQTRVGDEVQKARQIGLPREVDRPIAQEFGDTFRDWALASRADQHATPLGHQPGDMPRNLNAPLWRPSPEGSACPRGKKPVGTRDRCRAGDRNFGRSNRHCSDPQCLNERALAHLLVNVCDGREKALVKPLREYTVKPRTVHKDRVEADSRRTQSMDDGVHEDRVSRVARIQRLSDAQSSQSAQATRALPGLVQEGALVDGKQFHSRKNPIRQRSERRLDDEADAVS